MSNINPEQRDKSEAKQVEGDSRRTFIKKVTAVSVTLLGTNLFSLAADSSVNKAKSQNGVLWFKRVKRWGQINITLDTAANFDVAWWRDYWKKTQTQGIVLTAGGIYAYYPTKVPHHYRAPLLGDHDLFGDQCRDMAYTNGRIYSNRTN